MLLASLLLAATLPVRWTMAVGGDAMFNGISPESKPIAAIETIMAEADVAIINLEIPLTTANTPTPKKSAADRAARKQFVLKGSPKHMESLSRAGIDVVSLANNHGMDFGPKGAAEQRQLLDKWRIIYAGTGANEADAWAPVRYRDSKGIDLTLTSFLSFMADSANDTCWPAKGKAPGIASLKFGGDVGEEDRKAIDRIVNDATRKSPFVVIALHWGIERQTVPTPYQVSLARSFVDAGADLILGHHPHVLQGAEMYRGKPIFYSLGNFVSKMSSTSAVFTLRFNRDSMDLARMTPIRMAGKVRRLSKKEDVSELKRFRKLCELVGSRFPSPHSQPPKIVL